MTVSPRAEAVASQACHYLGLLFGDFLNKGPDMRSHVSRAWV